MRPMLMTDSRLGVLERIIAGLTLPMDQVEHLHSL